MSILRKDPVSSGWVIMVSERFERPESVEEGAQPVARTGSESCPFCPGRESETPHEIVAFREEGTEPDGPGWRVRTIPNKFAALRIEGDLDRRGEGIYDLMNGVGAHEVIIETPDHNAHMAYYSREKMEEVLRMYILRYRDLFSDKRFRYIQVFRNYGVSAGATLDHPHSQLIALPITPRWVKEELNCALSYYRLKERCLFCDIIHQEVRDRQRVVFENAAFVSLEPFASKFPYETWLLPKEHAHDFSLTPDEQLPLLAEALRRTLYAIAEFLNDPPLNFIIHSAPRFTDYDLRVADITIEMDYHWHIEIFPRITRMAGFEWGTGFYINPVLPEKAAEDLRGVLERTAAHRSGGEGRESPSPPDPS